MGLGEQRGKTRCNRNEMETRVTVGWERKRVLQDGVPSSTTLWVSRMWLGRKRCMDDRIAKVEMPFRASVNVYCKCPPGYLGLV
jgi:hypothetical protein